MMPRFDLLNEMTSVYLPKAGDGGPVLPKRRPQPVGRVSIAAALVVLLAVVVGL